MDVQEFERLEDLTMLLLSGHRTFSSKDFMEVYDIIYSHCTETAAAFETRGAKVYECLERTMVSYVDRLRCFTSLKTLHGQLLEFSGALDLVARAYSYLERYFIRVSLERRDGHIQDVRVLGYTVFYRRYMERMMAQAKEMIFFEIGVSRGSRDYNFGRLGETVKLLKRMLFFCNESEEYEDMIQRYLDGVEALVDFTGEINKILKRVYLEIYIASKVFDPDNNRLYKGIAAGVRNRFDDVLGLLVHKMERFEKFKLYVKIVHFMEPEYMARIDEKYKEILRKKVLGAGSLRELVVEYLNICRQMEENLMREDELVPYLREEIRKHLHMSGRLGFEDEVYRDIDRTVRNGEEMGGEMEALVMFVSLMSSKEVIVGKIARDARRRLMSCKSNLKREEMLVLSMEKHLGASISRCMSVMYENQANYVRNSFRIAGQATEFVTETRFLTKGFYDLRASGESLPPPLRDVWRIVSQPKMAQYPRGELLCCHSLSPMVFSMNGFNFRMNTDKVVVMLWLDVDRGVSDLERCVGGTGFRQNLEYLLSNGFVMCTDGVLSLNRMFSCREYGYIRNKYRDRICLLDSEHNLVLDGDGGSGMLEEVVDLFEAEISEAVAKRETEATGSSSDAVLEARVMRILKREKRVESLRMCRMVGEEFGDDEKAVMQTVEKLIEKEYCRADGDYLEYVP
ncbi:CULLIN HOMOLOG (CDC53 family) [Encephalitozoon cuniculi GB-M1]|uniref:CULLIN HOMOLOG (CDC53 family) n=1 Tax=Encephalitozoon cuniculi (strain GB-M1) TaxID=284813 RepID=Q8SRQ4_ENCCU|nr:uncharacterized protein ECU06_0880 [Encephalitozoon cuniculi GB-M1]CAD25448.2 CULLIN HOMOLOG (CDC53 family) [Encephalitozoon cuniculi GB-M1]